ncbi:hypothetical protein IQ07DRAFT_586641 [Pyrenochaeta sp. DS3sAY3a]|nr:hypothetical protein IQ07DRAFT_586641 [Pyrenochaeta sp. DS3sAY3a]
MRAFVTFISFTLSIALVIARDTVNNARDARVLDCCEGHNSTLGDDFIDLDHIKPATGVDNEELWRNSVEQGTKLLQGMKSNDKDAAVIFKTGETAESVYDGDLKDALREWGYNDNTEEMQKLYDKECDFNYNGVGGHELKDAFDELGLKTASKRRQGPNECFQIEHYDSPAVGLDPNGNRPEKMNQYYEVCGKKYRVTGAQHTIGVNFEGGAVFAISISSPVKAARRLWKRAARPEELPHIRTLSDFAWAFWNRAAGSGDLTNIKYFFVTLIINTETNKHVRRALASLEVPKEEIGYWPGTEFSMDTEAGKALLGSPVGRWGGYFLIQHKRQLGGDKYISKVRVFASAKYGDLPYLLFYVSSPAVALASGLDTESDQLEVEEILKRKSVQRNIIREHIMRPKL